MKTRPRSAPKRRRDDSKTHSKRPKLCSIYSENINGLLLLGTRFPAVVIDLVQEYLEHDTKIAAGSCHSLVLLKDGRLLAVGSNKNGQLGIGNRDDQIVPVLVDLNRDGNEQRAIAVSAGEWHSLTLLENGRVLAMGSNNCGQLGIGNQKDQNTPVLVNLGKDRDGNGHKAVAVTAGGWHSLILIESGQVLTTGNNKNGQLGIGNQKDQNTPVLVNLGKDENGNEHKAIAVAAGGWHSLILIESGQVLATGHNENGQLGIGNQKDQNTPVLVNLGKNENGNEHKAIAVAAGNWHSLVLLEDGRVLAMGYNRDGELGIGNLDDQNTPVLVNLGNGNGQKAIAIAAGNCHSLVLLEDGRVLAMGWNLYGQLGIGNRGDRKTPVPVKLGKSEDGNGQKAIAIAAGADHNLIVLKSGRILAMGRNSNGQLGTGSHHQQSTPVLVNLGKDRD